MCLITLASFMFSAVLKLNHSISPSEYESRLGGEDIVSVAVVIKDTRTEESFLATQEFSLSSAEITVEVQWNLHPLPPLSLFTLIPHMVGSSIMKLLFEF